MDKFSPWILALVPNSSRILGTNSGGEFLGQIWKRNPGMNHGDESWGKTLEKNRRLTPGMNFYNMIFSFVLSAKVSLALFRLHVCLSIHYFYHHVCPSVRLSSSIWLLHFSVSIAIVKSNGFASPFNKYCYKWYSSVHQTDEWLE